MAYHPPILTYFTYASGYATGIFCLYLLFRILRLTIKANKQNKSRAKTFINIFLFILFGVFCLYESFFFWGSIDYALLIFHDADLSGGDALAMFGIFIFSSLLHSVALLFFGPLFYYLANKNKAASRKHLIQKTLLTFVCSTLFALLLIGMIRYNF